MIDYLSSVSAPSNATPDTEDVFVEIRAQSDRRTFGIRRVTVNCETENYTGVTKIRFLQTSTAGSGGTTTGAEVIKALSREVSDVLGTIKNGSTAFTPGTTVATLAQWAINGKIPFVWYAATSEDEIFLPASNAFCVMISASSASVNYSVNVEWNDFSCGTVVVDATTNSSANTEDQFVQIQPGSNTDHGIKRVRVCCKQATDATIKGRLVGMSTAGSGTISATPVLKDPTGDAAPSTYSKKDTTVAAPAGTIANTWDRFAFNGRDYWEWVSGEDDEVILSRSNNIFAVLVAASQASIPVQVTVEFEW